MKKRIVSLWLKAGIYERIKMLSIADMRTVSAMLAITIERGVPLVEQEVAAKLAETRKGAKSDSDAAQAIIRSAAFPRITR